MGGKMAKQLPPNIRINNGSLSFQKRIPKAVIDKAKLSAQANNFPVAQTQIQCQIVY